MIFLFVFRIIPEFHAFGPGREQVGDIQQEGIDVHAPFAGQIDGAATLQKSKQVNRKIKGPQKPGKLHLDAARLLRLGLLLPAASAAKAQRRQFRAQCNGENQLLVLEAHPGNTQRGPCDGEGTDGEPVCSLARPRGRTGDRE